ncbi:MAG TPA: DUF2721 domain-containing protein [Thermoanaerobaculia bacterium]
MQFSPPTLDSTLTVLGAMITPAVMILATGSLILTTTNRLVRVVDRVRAMLPEFEKHADPTTVHDARAEEKHEMLFEQLERATIRARLIQTALTRLYTALGFFLATSMTLGIISLTHIQTAWPALVLGLIGTGLLLYASVLLILESRISLAATYEEMDYIRRISSHHAPPKVSRARRWYRLFRKG